MYTIFPSQNEPYTIINESLTGQERFYGYAIDLIKMLAERANFTPEFYIAENDAYGSHLGGGVWDGMIGDLMKHVRQTQQQYLKHFSEQANKEEKRNNDAENKH